MNLADKLQIGTDKEVSPVIPPATSDTHPAQWGQVKALKEHEINGVRLTQNISGTFAFDWNAYSQFILTPTGAVSLSNSNLPTAPNTKVVSGIFKASSFAVTFPSPAFKAAKNNDPLSATLDTRFALETFPDYVLYTLENIPA